MNVADSWGSSSFFVQDGFHLIKHLEERKQKVILLSLCGQKEKKKIVNQFNH